MAQASETFNIFQGKKITPDLYNVDENAFLA